MGTGVRGPAINLWLLNVRAVSLSALQSVTKVLSNFTPDATDNIWSMWFYQLSNTF